MTLDLLPHFFFALPDGGRLRYAQMAPKEAPRGTILVIPGRREFIEKKYHEVGLPLLQRGFRVIFMEPRGQGLSSRFLGGTEYQRDHATDFQTHLDDLRAFYAAIVKPGLSEPLLVHGHSMGGHLALRWLAEDKPAVAGAFLTAPMVALFGAFAHVAVYGITWANICLFSSATAYVPTQQDYGTEDLSFANNPLTGDEKRFGIMGDYFAAHPQLAVGGVTWGWLHAAFESMNVLHTWPYLANIDVPVMAMTGDRDIVTPANEILPFLNQIPRARTFVVENARHDILNEADEARNQAWEHIDEFLTLTAPRIANDLASPLKSAAVGGAGPHPD